MDRPHCPQDRPHILSPGSAEFCDRARPDSKK